MHLKENQISDSVPADKPVGHEVRFNNPAALRAHVQLIGVYGGDPIIGQQVDLGPHTYLQNYLHFIYSALHKEL